MLKASSVLEPFEELSSKSAKMPAESVCAKATSSTWREAKDKMYLDKPVYSRHLRSSGVASKGGTSRQQAGGKDSQLKQSAYDFNYKAMDVPEFEIKLDSKRQASSTGQKAG